MLISVVKMRYQRIVKRRHIIFIVLILLGCKVAVQHIYIFSKEGDNNSSSKYHLLWKHNQQDQRSEKGHSSIHNADLVNHKDVASNRAHLLLVKENTSTSTIDEINVVLKPSKDGRTNVIVGESVKNISEHDQAAVKALTSLKKLQQSSNIVTNENIYWGDEVENLIPSGLSGEVAEKWILAIRSARIKVKSMESPTIHKCGRRPRRLNGFALLTDGSRACVRSQINAPWRMVAKSLSYWLARFLNLDNVPPVTLAYSNQTTLSEVKDGMRWKKTSPISLTMWVDGIDNSDVAKKWLRVPRLIRRAYRSGIPVTKETFKNIVLGDIKVNQSFHKFTMKVNQSYPKSTIKVQPIAGAMTQDDVVLVAQFGTMIVFDYITGNCDRLNSNHLFGKNTKVINNLAVFKTSPKLWLIDNEYGFLNYTSRKLHDKMIKTCCIFQRKVVEQLVSLSKDPSPWKTFKHFVFEHEPVLHSLKQNSWRNVISENVFASRVREVVRWFEQCEKGIEHYIK